MRRRNFKIRRSLLPPQGSLARRAFSLLELLVVLAILVSLATMATPQILTLIREGAVYEAADYVRDSMAEARRYAIETGIDYDLRYEINGSTIVILPAEKELEADEDQGYSDTEEYYRATLQLPEEITLEVPDGVQVESERLQPSDFGSPTEIGDSDGVDIPSPAQLADKTWSTPVRFRFDGTADDFELLVKSEEGLVSKVKLRGLTGSIRTGQVFPEEK